MDSSLEMAQGRGLVEPSKAMEIAFVYGSPPTEGSLSDREWRVRVASLVDTPALQTVRVQAPSLAEVYEESARATLQSLHRLGRSAATLTNAARALWSIGNFEEGRRCIEEALSEDGGFAPAQLAYAEALLHLGQSRQALEYASIYVGHPQFGLSASILAADSAFRLERFGESLQILQAAEDQWPRSVYPSLNSGIVHVSLGRTAEASASFRRATRIEPSLAEGHFGLALCYVHENIYKKAIREFRIGLALGGPRQRAVRNLARLLYSLKEHDSLASLLGPYLAEYKNDLVASFLYGHALLHLHQYEKARDVWTRSIDLLTLQSVESSLATESISESSLQNNIGVTFARQGRFDLAVENYVRALKGPAPHSTVALRNLASLHVLNRRLEVAASMVAGLKQQNPTDGETLLLEGWLELARGNPRRASEVFNLARADVDADGFTHAIAYSVEAELSGDYSKAIDRLRQSLSRFPREETLLNSLAYAYLQTGAVKAAEAVIRSNGWNHRLPHTIATEGLLFLWKDDFHRGVTYYNNAKELAVPQEKELYEQKKQLELAKYYVRHSERAKAASHASIAAQIGSKGSTIYAQQAQQLLNQVIRK